MKKSLTQRALGVVFGLLLAFGVLILMLSNQQPGLPKSVANTRPAGRRAALIVLQELGFEAHPWTQAPIFLAGRGDLLWMPKAPILADQATTESKDEDGQEQELELGPLSADDPRHPLHYGDFVRAGGSLLLPYNAENLEWLRKGCELEVPDWSAPGFASPLDLELDTGERLRVSLEPELQIATETLDLQQHDARGWHDLAWSADGQAFASWVQVAYGRVAFVADDSFLDNQRLGKLDNGLLMTRLVQSLEGSDGMSFDEFALGLWTPRSKAELMMSPGLIEFSLHALLALLLFVALHAWVREFPRDGKRQTLSPLLRVQSQAALLTRARRFDLLAQDLKLGVLLRVAQRLGLRAPDTKLDPPQRLACLAKGLAEGAPAGYDAPRWQPLLTDHQVQNSTDLEQLGHELRSFEQHALSLASNRPLAARPT